MSTHLQSYELTGKKEEVASAISNLSPMDTVFTSTTKKASVSNTLFQWMTDVDAVPQADSTGVQEGSDYVMQAMVEPKMLNSHTQIFMATAKVNLTAEAVGLYGRGKPMAYQMAKKGRELKRTIEMTLLSKQNGQAAGAGKAGKLDGVWCTREGGAAIPAENIITASEARTFKEDELQALTLALFNKGATCDVIMFPPEYAKALSALRTVDGGTNLFEGDAPANVNRKVDTYTDPLGQRFKLVVNRYMPADTIYVIDPGMFEQKILRNFTTKDLPANGDWIAKAITVELGLANKNPDATGIYDLSGAARKSK